jgi:predicted Zn-dependent protease
MLRVLRLAILLLPLVSLSACTANPATGQQSFTAFMSPEDEIQVGKREHPKILKEFGGAYEDAALAAYVGKIGDSLARLSELPDLKFTFTVLSDPKVNAFALPGGYVYITRGLLALADNEAEMAGVLAHEIGHITARHSAQRYSQAMAANIGLTLLGVLGQIAGAPAGAGDLVALGAQAALQGYSREQELEADMLGVRYMTRAGYSPQAMTSFFRKLDTHTRLEAAIAGNPAAAERFNIMSTHPRTANRIEQAIQLARVSAAQNPRFERDHYLWRIEGMAFGDDPKQGIRRGREFVHPELRFRFTVPPGFTLFNSPNQVVARGPERALIIFDLENERKARTVGGLAAYLVRDWGGRLSLREVESITVNGLDAATGHGRIQTRNGPMDIRLVAIRERPERLYRMVFVTPPSLTVALATEMQRTTFSFRLLSREEAAAIRPLRLKIVTVKEGDTAQALANRMPFEAHRLEWFEVLNDLQRGQPLVPGVKLKIIE